MTDLAVPGFTVQDLLTSTATSDWQSNPTYTNLILGSPGNSQLSAIQQAVRLEPTAVFLWIGNDDALAADVSGQASSMTQPIIFQYLFDELIANLRTSTSAQLIVANIPDITELPYMTPASDILNSFSAYTQVPPWVFADILGVEPGDLINTQGMQDIQSDIALAESGQPCPPLPAGDVMRAAQVSQVQGIIQQYNNVIAQDVQIVGGTLVDLHSLFDLIAHEGMAINGFRASMLSFGGVVGLDGIHPTETGYAIIANAFIASMNARLGTAIAQVDLGNVASQDPLFGPNVGSSILPWSYNGGYDTLAPDLSNASAYQDWPVGAYPIGMTNDQSRP